MTESDIRNDQLVDASNLAIKRLSRFSTVDEQRISQSFLMYQNKFVGIAFVSGTFQAQWRFGNPSIEFMRDNELIDQIPFGSAGNTRKAA